MRFYPLLILWLTLLVLTTRQFFQRRKRKWTFKPNALRSQYTRMRERIFLLSFFCIGLALLPLTRWTSNKDIGKWVDIMVMLDVSKSMQVADIAYQKQYKIDRITTAKNLLSKMVSKQTGNRWWLGVFAGEAVGISPLTADHSLFLTFLHAVDEHNINIWGTNLIQALHRGIDRFDTKENTRGKVLMILSDGGEEQVDIPDALQDTIKEQWIFVITIGLGTLQGGKVPEWKDLRGNIVYKNEWWQTVISKFNPGNLQSLAKQLNGIFFHINSLDDNKKILKSFNHIQTTALKQAWGSTPRSLRPYFLFLALISLLGWIVLGLDEKIIEKIKDTLHLKIKG